MDQKLGRNIQKEREGRDLMEAGNYSSKHTMSKTTKGVSALLRVSDAGHRTRMEHEIPL